MRALITMSAERLNSSTAMNSQLNATREQEMTTFYRQKACLLAANASKGGLERGAATSKVLPSRIVAQHMLVSHPGYVPVSLLLNQMGDDNDNAEVFSPAAAAKKESTIFLPTCCECGAALQPGWEGTQVRLKPIKRTRTQRRRASRQSAKSLRKKKAEASKAISNLGEYCQQADKKKIPLGCRNYLSIKCGACGDQSIVPGIRKQRRDTIGKVSSKTKDAMERKIPPEESKKGVEKQDRDDFISLSRKAPSASKSTIVDQGRKKKKKKPKSDRLLSFLSSLND